MKLNLAWVEPYSAPTLFQGVRFQDGTSMLNPTIKPNRRRALMFCKHGYALRDGKCRREICE